MANRKKSPPRRAKPLPYYFIVEGCTEENYIQCLKNIFKNHKAAKIKNCNGGNAKAVLHEANKLMVKYQDSYLGFIIWFDQDGCSTDETEFNLRKKLAEQENVDIYISAPCVEHWLLAHFQKINLAENQECKYYENRLIQYIKHYKKNDCSQLKRYLDSEKINTAIQNYPEIGTFCQKYFLS